MLITFAEEEGVLNSGEELYTLGIFSMRAIFSRHKTVLYIYILQWRGGAFLGLKRVSVLEETDNFGTADGKCQHWVA